MSKDSVSSAGNSGTHLASSEPLEALQQHSHSLTHRGNRAMAKTRDQNQPEHALAPEAPLDARIELAL